MPLQTSMADFMAWYNSQDCKKFTSQNDLCSFVLLTGHGIMWGAAVNEELKTLLESTLASANAKTCIKSLWSLICRPRHHVGRRCERGAEDAARERSFCRRHSGQLRPRRRRTAGGQGQGNVRLLRQEPGGTCKLGIRMLFARPMIYKNSSTEAAATTAPSHCWRSRTRRPSTITSRTRR